MTLRVAGHDVADLGLAEAGEARIAWAEAQMPVLRSIRERFGRERPLEALVVAACLPVTPETANLVRTLVAAGADVGLCASNPLSTQDEVAGALVVNHGAEVHAIQGEDTATYYRHIAAVVDKGPSLTMDDGADVISVLHGERRDLIPGIVGGTEETTTGVVRLRALEAQGGLGFPVIAVNEARTKQLFDNRYGTGQSTLDGILRATNLLLAGRVAAVFGYGWCGQGIARRARGAGASVVVCEVDPVRALEARMDGFEVMPGRVAAERADLMITATGGRAVVGADHLAVAKDGVVLANAGHFDVEIDLDALVRLAPERREVRPWVSQHVTADGRRLNLLADGRVVNLAAGEGHPAQVMDVAFAHQALCVEHLARHGRSLEHRVHGVPAGIDATIARLELAALGIEIDELTPAQEAYLHTWDQGT